MSGKIIKRILCGQAFVSYSHNEGGQGLLTYLQKKTGYDNDLSQMVTIELNDQLEQDDNESIQKILLEYGHAKDYHTSFDKTRGVEVYQHGQG